MTIVPPNFSRVRAFAVSEEDVLRLLTATMRDHPARIWLPRLDLPSGYKVQRVAYSIDRCCWLYLVEHPTFDVVPLGQVVPIEPSSEIRHTIELPLVLPVPATSSSAAAAVYRACPSCGADNHPRRDKCRFCGLKL